MKHSEFIELLNLYLDHEISATDAAKLEAEVQTNPTRRAIYQQYCRMQKACKQVVAEFQTEADSDLAVAEKKILAFESGHASTARTGRRAGGYYFVGTVAAAVACVAVIFSGRNRAETSSTLASVLPPTSVAVPAHNIEFQPVKANKAGSPRGLVSVAQRPSTSPMEPLPFTLLAGNIQGEAVLPTAEQADTQLAWIHAVQIAPLQQRVVTNNLQFDATLRTEERPLGSRAVSAVRPSPPADEMVTFQFRK